jgi:hypothetical protein
LPDPCAKRDVFSNGCVRVTWVMDVPNKEEALAVADCFIVGYNTCVVDRRGEIPNVTSNVGGFMPKYFSMVDPGIKLY